jgi:hypothetical protein
VQGENLECDCRLFINGRGGFDIGFDVACQFQQIFCLFGTPGDGLCGVPDFFGTYSLRKESTSSACYDDYGSTTFTGVQDICVRATHDVRDFTKISQCSMFYGLEECRACNVCESGRDITFDCANINFGTEAIPVNGPTQNSCVGLGQITSLGRPNRLSYFGMPGG